MKPSSLGIEIFSEAMTPAGRQAGKGMYIWNEAISFHDEAVCL
jgi:hypothetical protein